MMGNIYDPLCADAIRTRLDTPERFTLDVRDHADSTNSLLKQMTQYDEGYILIADSQSAGRGRLGRSFYSPPGSGVYFSVLLKPKTPADNGFITAAAAVAACDAISSVFGAQAGIKWVNDIYTDGRKVCGILAESALSSCSDIPLYVILGVGINVYMPEGGFPAGISEIAGALSDKPERDGRNSLISFFINRFFELYRGFDKNVILEAYREREIVTGKKITVLSGGNRREALAVGIDGSCGLIVEYPDGSAETLVSGEVSIIL